MAKVHAPFPMTRTMAGLTFYMMDGVNYVRTKSSLTRKRVLKSPNFRKTRFYAGLMSQASTIGSVIYQALPQNWRQGWMYRAFTGEAMQMLKEGQTVEQTTTVLWKRYVEAINHRGEDLANKLQDAVASASKPPKGRRKKTDPGAKRLEPYSELLAEASKIASLIYQSLPAETRKFAMYQACVSEAMRVLQAGKKDAKNQFNMPQCIPSYTDDASQGVSSPDEPLMQVPSDVATARIIKRSFTNIKKAGKLPMKNRLFYIPPVGNSSSKGFAKSGRHRFRVVSG